LRHNFFKDTMMNNPSLLALQSPLKTAGAVLHRNNKGWVLIATIGLSAALISGCATQSSSSAVYRSSDTQREQTVRMAVVESVREVTIQRDSKGIGTVGGAVIGGIAGSSVGGGRGQDIATVVGAIGGMVAGQAIENQANQRKGYEITLKYDSGETRVIVQEADVEIRAGDRVRVVTGPNGALRVTR
jgi:outer membrane lipoprotein SlyB